jgi:hypothetical protein
MNEDEKNDWDRKADEIDEVIHELILHAKHEEESLSSCVVIPASVFQTALRRLECTKRHCHGLAESHRVNENTGKEGA